MVSFRAKTTDRLIGKDEDLRTDFYAALRRPDGRPEKTVDNINSLSRPSGTSKAYALQKLSDEGQVELLGQVKARKISSNEAMKRAGYRKPKISIRLDNPVSAAKTLLTHASPEFLAVISAMQLDISNMPLANQGMRRLFVLYCE